MKLKQLLITLTLMILALQAAPLVFAAPSVESILPPASVQQIGGGAAQIATSDLKDKIVPDAVKLFLSVVATISFVMFLYAGINLVISQGNEEEMTKFKNMMLWAVVGLLFITMSFAIVKGVLQLQFN